MEGTREDTNDRKRLGMNGMVEAFINKPNISGSYEEELDSVMSVFDNLSKMFQVTLQEKRQVMPIM